MSKGNPMHISNVAVCCAAVLIGLSKAQAQSGCDTQIGPHKLERKCGVLAPMPEMISFDRVAPLLDAIFEDVASMQIKPLQLGATDANATSLDALQESVQVAASYNVLDGLVNSKNADLLKSNAAVQQSILTQYSTGLAQYQSSFDQVAAAQAAKNGLDQNPTDQAGQDKLKAANETLAAVTAQQASIKSQLDNLKGQIAPVTQPTFTSSSPAAGTSAAGTSAVLKSSLLPNGFTAAGPAITNGTGSPNANAPSLPPTKQMDTQIGLLWDRLMRLLSTLGQPDSQRDNNFVVLRFYPSVLYSDKKTDGIQLTYKLSCDNAVTPTILDVYPRIAPVNVLNEKVRSRSWNLAAVLGFPGANATVNYNREHLKLTNTLSQSSFVTGFGAGTDTFGWTMGRTLGDDVVAPGQREMYALAAIPKNCDSEADGSFKVDLLGTRWISQQKVLDVTKGATSRSYAFEESVSSSGNYAVTDLNYSQAAADKAPITITLRDTIDAEARILVNGLVLQRSRDGFGRATPSPSANAGSTLFENTPAALAPGSWTRISERQITLLLDPGLYADRLPLITLVSPRQSVNLTEAMAGLTFNGVPTFWPGETQLLPGLQRPATSALLTGKALRWQAHAGNPSPDDHIVISLDTDSPSANSTGDSLQTVASSEPHIWGVSPIVVARASGVQVIVDGCEAKGVLLDCKAWQPAIAFPNYNFDSRSYTLTVYDANHAGAKAIAAQVSLRGSVPSKDRKPLFVSVAAPVYDASLNMWRITYPVISSQETSNVMVSLTTMSGRATNLIPVVSCAGDNGCTLGFDLPVRAIYGLTDSMKFDFAFSNVPLSSTQISGLRSTLGAC